MKVLKTVSVIIFAMMVFQFMGMIESLFGIFGVFHPVFRVVFRAVLIYFPAYILGVIEVILNIVLYKKAYDTLGWEKFYIISAIFCLALGLFELLMMYIATLI